MEHFARLRECHLRFELRLIPETLGFAFAHLHGAIVERDIDGEARTFVGLTFCAHPSAMTIGNLFYD